MRAKARRAALRWNAEAKQEGFFFGIPLGTASFVAAPSQTVTFVDMDDEDMSPDPVNTWRTKDGHHVDVYQDSEGRATVRVDRRSRPACRLNLEMWSLRHARNGMLATAERRAQTKLRKMLSKEDWEAYFLTGRILVQSDRSLVYYLIRRGLPTIAYRHEQDVGMRVLCAMCLHPLGYYTGSWSGTLCPSDDTIAHLLFIRGDECGFWRKANQHPPDGMMSGL